MTYVAVLLIFFISGIIALGYQVLWSKYLLVFIGVGSYSYATVLAAFMSGLALGSWLIGKLVDRMRSPLKLYAYLELGIGIYALGYPHLTDLAASMYASAVQFTSEQAGGSVGLGMKIVVSALLLLLPTTLMGGTYPALLRHVTRNMQSLGKRASQLYSINAFGAVAGSLLMAFVFMPALGMSASLMLLAISNASIALLAFLLSGFTKMEPKSVPSTKETSVSFYSPWQLRLGYWLIFLEGFLAFVYEIGWTRYFALTLGSSTYSFAIILAVFISGIAIGSAILAALERRINNPLMFFGFTQIGAAVWLIASLPFYQYMPWMFLRFNRLLSTEKEAFYLYELGKVVFCYAIMLPAAIFIGMAVPLVVKGLSRSIQNLGHDVGRIFSVNTWGNVSGALAAGILLLPLLGMEHLLYFAAGGTAALGIVALLAFAASSVRSKRLGILGAFLTIALIFAMTAGAWNPLWFTLLPFRRHPVSSFEKTRQKFHREKVLMFKDDPAAHLIVTDVHGGIHLYVNGKPDATSGVDMTTQILCAHLPLVLKPDTKDVLVIGLASGVTAGMALKHPIQRLDVVEIVRSMPVAATYFSKWNRNPLKDPRSHLIIDDARSYLSYTNQKYDLIISEPSNPWIAGTGSLYSTEFYPKAKQKLNKGGIYLQWLQCYEMSDETFAAVVRSFTKSFRFVYAFHALEMDMLLIASDEPLRADWNSIQTRFNQQFVQDDLKAIGIEDLSSMLLLQAFSPGSMTFIGELTSLENNDDNHLLEYRAPVDLFQDSEMSLVKQFDDRNFAPSRLLWGEYLAKHQNPGSQLLSVGSMKSLLSPQLLSNLETANYYLHPEDTSLFTRSLNPPKPPEFVAQTISELIRQKEFMDAASTLKSVTSPIIISSTLSADKARFWIDQIRRWAGIAPADSELLTQLRALYIDVLITRGHPTAPAELLAFAKSKQLPTKDWFLLRALRIGETRLLQQIPKMNPALQ